ncbi:MAG TPA: endolytic transglycosylase MltG [Xanthobacteraceae bacterium]|nr:endolytic transglycosylase MltG [Xanthobacteraceae bacterium]
MAPRSPRAALEPEQVIMPIRSRRPRNPLFIFGNALFTLLLLLGLAGGAAFMVGKQRFEAPGPLAEEKTVIIPRNSGVRDIADLLQKEGVIDQPWLFVAGVVALKAREDLKYGEYQFAPRASLREVVGILMEGKVVQHTLTIPEGLTSEQIVARLTEHPVLTGNIREIPREGTLLPETYKFTRGTTREQMIQRMQQQHRKLVQEIWERRMPDLPLRTPEQLVILASIIEKETGKPEERTRVAAVFVNRLKQRMKLQSDPTIIYGLVGGKGTLGRPIMKSEIEQPTPYNTYVIDGLPPGPIANPGRASLEAAANPARTRELYFVADGTGGHVFSENYEQHLKAVARLRAIEQGAAARASGAPPLPGRGPGTTPGSR